VNNDINENNNDVKVIIWKLMIIRNENDINGNDNNEMIMKINDDNERW